MGGDTRRIWLIVRIGSWGKVRGVSLIMLVLRRRPVSQHKFKKPVRRRNMTGFTVIVAEAPGQWGFLGLDENQWVARCCWALREVDAAHCVGV